MKWFIRWKVIQKEEAKQVAISFLIRMHTKNPA